MRKGIIYMLMFIFLLFIAENKSYVDLQPSFGIHNLNVPVSKLVKKFQHNSSLEKSNSQHGDNSSISNEEPKTDDLKMTNHYFAIAIFSLFSLGYIFKLLYLKRKKPFFVNTEKRLPFTKTFLFLETIRL